MTEDDYLTIELAEPTRSYIKSPKAEGSRRKFKKYKNSDEEEDDDESDSHLFRRQPRSQSALKRRFGSFRGSFRKLNCFKSKEDEAVPMMEVPRHKSIDIGVGLARKMSLFLFTRRTVCVHPYHPYTPEQTTRKLYFCFDNKHNNHDNKH